MKLPALKLPRTSGFLAGFWVSNPTANEIEETGRRLRTRRRILSRGLYISLPAEAFMMVGLPVCVVRGKMRITDNSAGVITFLSYYPLLYYR
jgi:hypothetical protein